MREVVLKQQRAAVERARHASKRDPVAVRANIRRRADKAMNTAEDVLAKLAPQWNGCILWTGAISPGRDDGYGWVNWQSRQVRAHRFFYEQFYGEIPYGMLVLHKCDIRNCVNPDHLFLGNAKDNVRDMVSKGRAPHQNGTHREKYRNHCGNGHEYTVDNTAYRIKPNGRKNRVCRICKREALRRWNRGHRVPDLADQIDMARMRAKDRLADDLHDIAIISDEWRNK